MRCQASQVAGPEWVVPERFVPNRQVEGIGGAREARANANIGLDTRALEPGAELIVATRNTVYTIRILDQTGSVMVHGGSRFPAPRELHFTGSVACGEMFLPGMLRPGWIGPGMRMEFRLPEKVVRTSPVLEAALRLFRA